MRPVVNVHEAPQIEPKRAGDFAGTYAPLGETVGARKLGYNLTVLPPGKKAVPFHNHHVNEEMFFILEGEGTYRIGAETYPVRTGDIMAAPAGGRETAHHIINTGTVDLKYLSVSTMFDPEVAEYPDSDKFLVRSKITGETLRYIGRTAQSLDYFDGEI